MTLMSTIPIPHSKRDAETLKVDRVHLLAALPHRLLHFLDIWCTEESSVATLVMSMSWTRFPPRFASGNIVIIITIDVIGTRIVRLIIRVAGEGFMFESRVVIL